jgi:cbb3-type cytochrome oxidase maturation protein
MESLYFLVPVAFIFIAIAIKILWWAINNGQYDNLDTEAHRILFDEKIIPSESISLSNTSIAKSDTAIPNKATRRTPNTAMPAVAAEQHGQYKL